MFSLVFIVFVSFVLVLLLNAFSLFLSEHSFLSREELSSYECGFEHHGLSRIPFSFRYFYLTLVFLLFDLEIVLLLFSYISVFSSTWYLGSIVLVFCVWVLIFGLFFEWQDGSLNWFS